MYRKVPPERFGKRAAIFSDLLRHKILADVPRVPATRPLAWP